MISNSAFFQSFCVVVLAVVLTAQTTFELKTIQHGLTDTIMTLHDDGTKSVGDIFTRGNKIYSSTDPMALLGSDVVAENQGHCVRLTDEGDNSM